MCILSFPFPFGWFAINAFVLKAFFMVMHLIWRLTPDLNVSDIWSVICQRLYVNTWFVAGVDHFLGMKEYKEWTRVKAEEAKLWIHSPPDHKHSVSIFDQMTFAWEWVYTPSRPPLRPPTSFTSLFTTTLDPSVIWIKIVSLSDLCSTSQEYGTNLWQENCDQLRQI